MVGKVEMCKYCDGQSEFCEIWVDGLTNESYLEVNTGEYDEIGGELIYVKVYGISYCPYCGRKLDEK